MGTALQRSSKPWFCRGFKSLEASVWQEAYRMMVARKGHPQSRRARPGQCYDCAL